MCCFSLKIIPGHLTSLRRGKKTMSLQLVNSRCCRVDQPYKDTDHNDVEGVPKKVPFIISLDCLLISLSLCRLVITAKSEAGSRK